MSGAMWSSALLERWSQLMIAAPRSGMPSARAAFSCSIADDRENVNEVRSMTSGASSSSNASHRRAARHRSLEPLAATRDGAMSDTAPPTLTSASGRCAACARCCAPAASGLGVRRSEKRDVVERVSGPSAQTETRARRPADGDHPHVTRAYSCGQPLDKRLTAERFRFVRREWTS